MPVRAGRRFIIERQSYNDQPRPGRAHRNIEAGVWARHSIFRAGRHGSQTSPPYTRTDS
ncbi:hypothetical protein PUN4_1040052 [Paraburkholderia unamae]|nr:hypothetical protein PUN4_1040052 [Paraburkholderia unamae]